MKRNTGTNSDPWKFSSSSYELTRYAEIIRVLEGRTFDSGFEPGCSIGVLTESLADRCRRLLAMDISPTAVAVARQRCAGFPNVAIVEGSLPDDLPVGRFRFDCLQRNRILLRTRLSLPEFAIY